MKKIFTLIASVSFGLGYGQSSIQMMNVDNGSAVVPNGGVIYVAAAPSATVINNINIKNISSSSKTYKVTRTLLSMNSGAGTNFCFAGNCFPPTTYSASCVLGPGQTAAANASGGLQPYFWDGSTPGMSDVKYTFANTSDHADTATIIFRYNNPLGIANNDDMFNSVSDVFPNPAKEKSAIVLNATSEQEISFTIYNSLGSVVSARKVNLSVGKNTLGVGAENLPSGIYFAALVNGKTKVIKKFVVN